MMRLDFNQEPRRLQDFDFDELEAFIQRGGRSLQARAMGRALRTLLGALLHDGPALPRTADGGLDWERLLGLAPDGRASHACGR